ncbi:MAG TPA: hypothetical protein ENI23_03590 [bacterium]|nr:hypothetical protein [bacterium]
MPSKPPTDEQLIEAYYGGNENAFDTLFNRYYTRCLGFLFNKSFFKEEDYLDDIRSEIIRITISAVREKRFKPEGHGSFAAWFYRVAWLECINADKKRRRAIKNISQVYPDSRGPFPDDKIISKLCAEETDIPAIRHKLAKVFKKLSVEEKKLLILSVRFSYQKIVKMPEYSEFNVHSLAQFIYNIRKKIRQQDSTD